jgi:putative ABC transport system permease protein
MRRWLVGAQIAISLVLLVGAALFLRTLERALVYDPGFRSEGVTVARFSLSLLGYEAPARAGFVDRLLEATTGIQGVVAAGVGTVVPFQAGGRRGTIAAPAGYDPAPDESMRADLVHVGPAYFTAVGIPILRGRAITSADGAGAPPVAVISRVAAERWWRGRDPVGGTLRLGGSDGRDYVVVGVAGDVAWQDLGEAPAPYLFLSLAQAAPAGSLTLAVRSTADAPAVSAAVRSAFRTLDPDLALMALGPLDDWVAARIAPRRIAASLLTAFGVLAVIIAALGIYGVVSFAVARQTRAIGVRLALGARRSHVVRLVARGVAGPVVFGILAGTAAAWALGGVVRHFLFRVDPRDPVTLLAVATLLAAIAAAATIGPIVRASRIPPMEALRHE